MVLVALGLLSASIATNKNFDFRVVGRFLFSGVILEGVFRTLTLTVLAMTLASLLSLPLALSRLSQSRILRAYASGYVWIFRGTPVLVQLIFWFNLALVVPQVTLGIPGTSVSYTVVTNDVMTPFVAALVGLALNEAAYMAEIVRGGLLSVDSGQTEAALALGMTESRTVRRIVLPQAMRAILPPGRQRTHHLSEDDGPGQHHLVQRAARDDAGHLQRQLPDDRTVDRCEPLVLGVHHRHQRHPALR